MDYAFHDSCRVAFELRLREEVPGFGIVGKDRDNALAWFNNCSLVFRYLSALQLISQLLKLQRFSGGESAGSQQNKNGDRERSQRGSRSWTSRSKGSSIFRSSSDGFQSFLLRRLGSCRSLRLRLPRPQKGFSAGAELENLAPAAVRIPRITTASSVPDEPVTPVCPMLARYQLHQIELNLHRILLFR